MDRYDDIGNYFQDRANQSHTTTAIANVQAIADQGRHGITSEGREEDECSNSVRKVIILLDLKDISRRLPY